MAERVGLEQALDVTQAAADGALKTANGTIRELRKARGAAAAGQLRELRRALDSATILAAELQAATTQAQSSFAIADEAHLTSGAYAKELLAFADDRGVAMFSEDDVLLCYPSIVRVLASDTAIEVDRRREKRLRPPTREDDAAAAGDDDAATHL